MWWLLVTTICLSIGWNDLQHRVVKNKSVLLLAGILAFSIFLFDSKIHLIQASLVLISGMCLWKVGVFGAGDIKLASVFAIFIAPDYSLLVLFLMLVIGGVEALLYLLIRTTYPHLIRHGGIPFAIPIVISGFFGISASI
ncbi:prepilin peptidase [Vibrio sinaloensis]|uniref:prepilin peptidase n=1 Tax=Photobacterium sp. (strain ATCC 43367) TaxID=379097 RepID=UPI00058768C3|nr:prepilin peptidase [Vibrio sinaloensis]